MVSGESRRLNVRGVPMRWEERGEGRPVVLIHGLPTNPTLWRHVLPLLRAARCLAFELIGYGASIDAGRGRDISVARQADYLLAWLDELGIDHAVFVGHDLGGGVAQIAAVRQPDRCAGLVLNNCIAYDSWPPPSLKALRAAAPALRRLPPPAVKPVIAQHVFRGHDDVAVARESLPIHWRHYEVADAAGALVRQVRSLNVRDTVLVQDHLKKLDAPACVVWGAADPFQKVESGERLSEDLGTDLRRIDDGKHFTPEDHPEEVAGAINEVLALSDPAP